MYKYNLLIKEFISLKVGSHEKGQGRVDGRNWRKEREKGTYVILFQLKHIISPHKAFH